MFSLTNVIDEYVNMICNYKLGSLEPYVLLVIKHKAHVYQLS